MGEEARQVVLGGAPVDLMHFPEALQLISDRAAGSHGPPLAVVSANLDHIRHFGAGGPWDSSHSTPDLSWLSLLDGAPLVSQARRLTGTRWPRLAGSDLIEPLLAAAERRGLRVGFLGGSTETQRLLRQRLPHRWPQLRAVGWWSPDRSELTDATASTALAERIAAAGVDLLVVGLGKPRQEQWISSYGAQTGARVLLAFGAVVDFLAGRVGRAPAWVSSRGLEWAWRLGREPKRLARRYLIEGPPAYLRLRRRSSVADAPSYRRPGREEA
jgi:exopolysaccharide biosynthesis WecB/TagA/CpsF family protein